jgi:hypothetical protein
LVSARWGITLKSIDESATNRPLLLSLDKAKKLKKKESGLKKVKRNNNN